MSEMDKLTKLVVIISRNLSKAFEGIALDLEPSLSKASEVDSASFDYSRLTKKASYEVGETVFVRFPKSFWPSKYIIKEIQQDAYIAYPVGMKHAPRKIEKELIAGCQIREIK